MATDRTPRDIETRETEKRYEYSPTSALPQPADSPDFSYRYVMTHVMGVLDPMNASTRMREGWEPVKAKDHPELMIPGNKDGNVEIGGLMLCRMPKERLKARARYFQELGEKQMASVDNTLMRQNDARMPLFSERSTEETRGSGFGKGTAR